MNNISKSSINQKKTSSTEKIKQNKISNGSVRTKTLKNVSREGLKKSNNLHNKNTTTATTTSTTHSLSRSSSTTASSIHNNRNIAKSIAHPLSRSSSTSSSIHSTTSSTTTTHSHNSVSSTSTPPSVYSSNYSVSNLKKTLGSSELEELTNLNTQLVQWNYLNALTVNSFQLQKEDANQQLYNGYQYLIKQKDEFNDLQNNYLNKKNIKKVNEDLDIQEECLSNIKSRMGNFQNNYEVFIKSLHSTASKMTTHGIITKDIETLVEQFYHCENILKEMVKDLEKIKKIEKLANSINSLNAIINEEMSELEECKELLNNLKKAETLNNSIQIQYKSLIAEKE